MCLGVPGKIISINDTRGMALIGGIQREVFLQLVPEVKLGEYVLVHAGCALAIIDEVEAESTLCLLKELSENEIHR